MSFFDGRRVNFAPIWNVKLDEFRDESVGAFAREHRPFGGQLAYGALNGSFTFVEVNDAGQQRLAREWSFASARSGYSLLHLGASSMRQATLCALTIGDRPQRPTFQSLLTPEKKRRLCGVEQAQHATRGDGAPPLEDEHLSDCAV